MTDLPAQLVIPDSIDFDQYLAGPGESARVKTPSSYAEKVKEMFSRDIYGWGLMLPFPSSVDKFRIRPCETSIWAGINGHGKAVALDTPILTMRGWTVMGEIKVGDIVFDERGVPCHVTGTTDVMHGHRCFRMEFSDGSVVIADADHEWVTKTQKCLRSERRAARQPLRRKTRSIPGNSQSHKRTVPAVVTTAHIAETLKHKQGNTEFSNHAIPVAGQLWMPSMNLPVDPYVLGVWLGDGCKTHGSLYGEDEEIFDRVRAAGYEVRNVDGKFKHTAYGLVTQLRALGLLKEKYIPYQYLFGSAEQRLELLRGLMDTDGCITVYGRCEFTNTNKDLADGVLFLARSLGIKAKMITGRSTLYGKDCGEKYRVTFTTAVPVFHLPRKVERIPAFVSTKSNHRFIVACDEIDSVPVRCIQVDSPSHQYLVGEALIPTHNSLVHSQVQLGLMRQGAKICVASMEMPPAVNLQRMIIQASGVERPSEAYIDAFMQWAEGRLFLYDQQGTVKSDRILALARYAQSELKCDHFVIDSLMKCGIGVADYDRQKSFVDEITSHGMDTGMHMHIIAHSRKGEDEYTKSGKMDVKGTSEITDQVDNLFMVWRNKEKEERINKGDTSKDWKSMPDATVDNQKQRHGRPGSEYSYALWLHKSSQTFSDNPRKRYQPLELELGEDEVPF